MSSSISSPLSVSSIWPVALAALARSVPAIANSSPPPPSRVAMIPTATTMAMTAAAAASHQVWRGRR